MQRTSSRVPSSDSARDGEGIEVIPEASVYLSHMRFPWTRVNSPPPVDDDPWRSTDTKANSRLIKDLREMTRHIESGLDNVPRR